MFVIGVIILLMNVSLPGLVANEILVRYFCLFLLFKDSPFLTYAFPSKCLILGGKKANNALKNVIISNPKVAVPAAKLSSKLILQRREAWKAELE